MLSGVGVSVCSRELRAVVVGVPAGGRRAAAPALLRAQLLLLQRAAQRVLSYLSVHHRHAPAAARRPLGPLVAAPQPGPPPGSAPASGSPWTRSTVRCDGLDGVLIGDGPGGGREGLANQPRGSGRISKHCGSVQRHWSDSSD